MPYKFKFEINQGSQQHPDYVTSYEEIMNSTQCHGHTKAGTRCKRKCIVGFEYCPSHLASIKNLKIMNSNIAGAGKGLFVWHKSKENTNEPVFKKGDPIINYEGKQKTMERIHDEYGEYTAPYAIEYKQGQALDAGSKRGVGSLANHKSMRLTNVELVTRRD